MKTQTIVMMIASAALAVGTAQANPVNFSGDIEFQATGAHVYSTDKGYSLGTISSPATKVTAITGATVSYDTGDFTAIAPGTAASFHTPIVYNPATPDNPLWTVLSGGLTYEFFATSMAAPTYSYAGTSINQVTLTGDGYLDVFHGESLCATGNGDWTLQLEKNGSALNFQSGATVPDGGLTMAMLGGGMLALGAIRRKLS